MPAIHGIDQETLGPTCFRGARDGQCNNLPKGNPVKRTFVFSVHRGELSCQAEMVSGDEHATLSTI
jgi:hypothetical protein